MYLHFSFIFNFHGGGGQWESAVVVIQVFLFIDAQLILSTYSTILWFWLIHTESAPLLMPGLTEGTLGSLVREGWWA